MTIPQPTLAGFQSFVTDVMKVPAKALPAGNIFVPLSFSTALAIVNPALQCIAIPQFDAAGAALNTGGYSVYSQAVYNLAADNLINFAIDQPGNNYFAKLRKAMNIGGFVSGVVQGSADQSTSVSLVVQEAAKNFTLANLQQLKTPYGRYYLSLAQSYGPTTWGIT